MKKGRSVGATPLPGEELEPLKHPSQSELSWLGHKQTLYLAIRKH
jgi:hypothetical protein